MTPINYDLISEIIFTHDNLFNNLNKDEANVVSSLCKNAKTNKDVMLSVDRVKAYKYLDKIFDIITHHIMYKKKVKYMERETLSGGALSGGEFSITSQLEDITEALKKENENVLYGFRELIVMEFKEYKYNYEKARDSFDIKYNLDYCIQYNLVINNLGFYEYYETHTYDPKHFVLKPDSLYDFVSEAAANAAVAATEA
jgi:hypothetical protein